MSISSRTVFVYPFVFASASSGSKIECFPICCWTCFPVGEKCSSCLSSSLSHLNYTFTMQFSCIINAYANWSLAGLFSVTGPEMRLKEERITHDILVWNSQVFTFEIVDIWLSSRERWRCNSIPGSCSGEWVVGCTSEIIKCATFIRS